MNLKHEVGLRLRAIELISYWEGRLITGQLMEMFGISRQQASSDINRYNTELNVGALIHDSAAKGYIPITGFRPVLSTGQIDEYLNLVSAQPWEVMGPVTEGAGIVTVGLPDQSVRPEVIREMIKACRQGRSLKILYASMVRPLVSERTISPHTLVYTGFRWHVRAWSHEQQEFLDYPLSRIDRVPTIGNEQGEPITADHLWHELTTVTLTPNRFLSIAQQALVERDFAMPEGRLRLSVRKALVPYVLQRYQVAVTDEDAMRFQDRPLQLLPSDLSKIESFAFKGEST